MKHNVLPTLLLPALLLAASVHARQPEFSSMTLNGLTRIAVEADDIPGEIAALGLTPERIESHAQALLADSGLSVVSLQEAISAPGAGKLRIRLVTNRDGYGVYYYGMKLELRQKIMLGNPAGGFVSQVVWTDGESGTMLASESAKPLAALDRMLTSLVQDYRAQNAATP